MSKSETEPNLTEAYDPKHAVEVMKMLNEDRKVDREYCDGTIISNGKQYDIHKCVVSVVSQFFGRTFVTEMREKYNNVVNIDKISPEVLEQILDFVYTGIVEVTEENVLDLLDGAEFTQIPRIKLKCSDHLKENMNVENCLKLRAYGRRYNLEGLEKVSRRLIAQNFVAILKHNDFVELNADEISIIVGIRKDKASEEAVFTAIVRWVNHNLKERESLFVKLFSLVDLNLMSQSFLNKQLTSEPLVLNTLECMQHLLSFCSRLKLVAGPELSIIVNGGEASEKNCFVFHFNPDSTEDLPMLNVGRCAAAACKTGNNLFLIGGGDKVVGGEAYKSVEVLDLQSRTAWKEISNMLEAREYFACEDLGGMIYACGGWNRGYLSSCEKYDCTTKHWMPIKNMLCGRAYHAMAVLNDSLYCAGGYDGITCLSSVERYDTVANLWKMVSPMIKERELFALVALNDHLYAIGGCNVSFLACTAVEKYDPDTNKWVKVQPLRNARSGHGAAVFHGRIYVFGGRNESDAITSVEVYDDVEDKWEVCYKMKSTSEASTAIAV